MSLVIFVISGAIGWLRPVVGFGLFMLLQTPLGNANTVSGHFLSEQGLFILATGRLLLRKPKRSGSWRPQGVEICALAFSLVVLLRQVEFMSGHFSRIEAGVALCLTLAFGPLLVAFSRLEEKELASLRLWLSVAGIVVGVWGALIYLTGSGYLTHLASWDRTAIGETVASSESGDANQLVTGRFIVLGLFLVVPSAYWYVLRGALVQTRQRLLANMGMWVGVTTILITAAMSVTRSTIFLLGLGTMIMLATMTLSGEVRLRATPRTIAFALLGACLLGTVFYLIDLKIMAEMAGERFSAVGHEDSTTKQRLDFTANAWAYLNENLCFFGAPGPDPFANCNGTIDMPLPLHVWLWYGVPGVALFYIVLFVAFGRLFKSWLAPGLSREQKLLRSMLTAWSMYFICSSIIGACMTVTELFFAMLFVFETGRLKGNRLSTTNLKAQRPAA